MKITYNSSNTGTMTTFRVHSFDFKGTPVRVYVDPEGNQWWEWVGIDSILRLKMSMKKRIKLLRSLPDDYLTLTDDTGAIVNFLVSELNVLFLIQQSKDPDAHEFKLWVTCKILPYLYNLYPIQRIA